MANKKELTAIKVFMIAISSPCILISYFAYFKDKLAEKDSKIACLTNRNIVLLEKHQLNWAEIGRKYENQIQNNQEKLARQTKELKEVDGYITYIEKKEMKGSKNDDMWKNFFEKEVM